MNEYRKVLGCMGLIFLSIFGTSSWIEASDHETFTLPTPLGYVSDYAEILDRDWEARIRSVCKELENRTGVEMIVVTTPTVHPKESALEYATALYKGWRIGTAQQERGILMLTSVKERQAVVVLGRNLLSVISKQQLNELTQRHFTPMFQAKQFGEPLYKSTVLLATKVGNLKAPPTRKRSSKNMGFWLHLLAVLAMVFALWRFTRPERRHPFQRWRRGEYWRTGQGGFGGNFGGFGGGMSGRGLG